MGNGQWLMGNRVSAKEKPEANQCLSANNSAPQPVNTSLATNDGVILIALLWILTALAVIALSFSKESRLEYTSARNAQSMKSAYFAATAGIANTIYYLKMRKNAPSQTTTTTTTTTATTTQTLDTLDLGYVEGSISGAVYHVDFMDESGKLPLNSVTEQQLRLLIEACYIPQPDEDIIVDSILDWRTQGTQPRTNGAKDDYYQSLNPPYKCKNANFDTVEELLLVRGITPDYFYGHPERIQGGPLDGMLVYKYGLSRCFTVYTSGSTVNVNSAPLPVLLSTGMSEGTAQAIIDARRLQQYKTITDLMTAFPDLSGMTGKLSTPTPSSINIFTLIATAVAENSKARRVIRATINLTPPQGSQALYQTCYWNENIPDYEGYSK
jgi:general secretion pathway protein K